MSIVAMRRKYNEKKKAKITQKNRNGRNKYSCRPDEITMRNTTMSYGSFLKRKMTRYVCHGDVITYKQRNVVKDRVNSRIPASQKIENKKLAILQRIRCDNKKYVKKGTPEWTITINSQNITESAGVTVTQGSNTGTLKAALDGTTSFIIYATSGNDFVITADIMVGSTTVLTADLVSITVDYKKLCMMGTRSKADYIRRQNLTRFCNTTKDLGYAGNGKSYNELYAAMKTEKAFSCDDLKKENPNDPKC